MSYQDIYLTSK